MSKKLSQAEIAKRLIRLRNLEQLHRLSKQRRRVQDELIETQAKQIANCKELIALQEQMLQNQAIRIAELEAMVFGKKKQPPSGTPSGTDDSPSGGQPKQPRGKDSYRRPIPPDEAVTDVVALSLPSCCPHCSSDAGFVGVTSTDRYREDIPLPELTPGYTAHLITKYEVQSGICAACRKPVASMDLGGALVSLGPNVRLLVCQLIAGVGLSYSQATNLLLSLYGVHVTDGEVAAILQKQHQAWLPAYERLKVNIRGAPAVHADESPWAIQELQGQGYAWVLADALSTDVCYVLASGRGAPHARALFGVGTDRPFAGVRITDDYAAYRSLPGAHQLCWAHLYRAIRDLRDNDNLPEEQLPRVRQWYETFAAIYQDLRHYLSEPYDDVVRQTQADELWQRVEALLPTAPNEPDKLRRLKGQLARAGQAKLFICLSTNTPCDNNRAERELRQLVLKRKRSFGSKTQKGAQALATILSICTTMWRRCGSSPAGYYRVLAGV